MNEVFRFLFLRPPEPGPAVIVSPSEDFRKELSAAASSDDGRAALKRAAARLAASGRALTALSDLNWGDKLLELEIALSELDDPSPDAVRAAVKDGFGSAPAKLSKEARFNEDRDRLADNLIAAKLLSRDGAVEAKRMEALLRVMDLVNRVGAADPVLAGEGAVRAALRRPTMVGGELSLPVRERPPKEKHPREPDKPDGRPEELRERIDTLEALSDTLTRVPPKSFVVPKALPARPPRARPDATEMLRSLLVEHIRTGALERAETPRVQAIAAELKAVESSTAEPADPQTSNERLVLTQAAAERLPERHRDALRSLGVSISETPLPSALDRITEELTGLHAELAELATTKTQYAVIGSRFYDLDELAGEIPPSWVGVPGPVPQTHGTVKPVGVGDLLIVRQQLKRYEGGEVGHIENILKGEFKDREHSRSRTTEETTLTEVETKKDEERDTQTTERFELQREASSVVKEDSSFKAGLSISGSYGPTVEFKASTDFAMNQAKEEAAKTASSYSKEVTDRASSKVSERHREERILRTLEVFEERNKHGVDNAKGTGHVIGVYQWVDKVYEAQVFNYGKRMMFDVMVPEPAAFWIYANTNKPVPGATLIKPQPFTLKPKDVTAANYGLYVQRYEVAGVKPPPEPYQTVSKTFDGSSNHDDHGGTKIAEVPIAGGYQAVSGHATAEASVWTDWSSTWFLTVAVGKDSWSRSSGGYIDNYFTLDQESGSVPIGILAFGTHNWMAAVEVDCQRTPRAYEEWQLETHAAIQQGYLKLERDYRDELAALEVQAANEIQGRNPAESRMIERAELKKQAISVFTSQHYDLFGAIAFSSGGYPQALLSEAEAEGRFIRFFEQAFEWEQMTYLFYPYFWGRKANWPSRVLLQDVDPQFAEFLKAGSARLVVPVRPGFESAIAHFLDTGEIWEGADPPTLTSPLYVSIIDEIKERTQAPGTEVAQGAPWDVRLPTTLTRLREDGSLPTWTKQPDGTWLPA